MDKPFQLMNEPALSLVHSVSIRSVKSCRALERTPLSMSDYAGAAPAGSGIGQCGCQHLLGYIT